MDLDINYSTDYEPVFDDDSCVNEVEIVEVKPDVLDYETDEIDIYQSKDFLEETTNNYESENDPADSTFSCIINLKEGKNRYVSCRGHHISV